MKPKVNLSATHEIKKILRNYKLFTVCEESLCPNISECFGERKTATFLLLGKYCTRYCSFCAIGKMKKPPPPDPDEITNLKKAVQEMKLKYVVLTSVNRDDLEDGGAEHLAKCISEVKKLGAIVEILSPDLKYKTENLDIVLSAKPDVFAHDIETVPSLYPKVRPKGNFEKSLFLLRYAKEKGFITKTSIIVGLGEKKSELFETIEKVRKYAMCDILVVGQYFQPSLSKNQKAYQLDESIWEELEVFCRNMEFKSFIVGPRARSSYLADVGFENIKGKAELPA
ncbi:Lipoyl synthase [bacterium HR19]|nr:Lipoyl synthase [bacterium HR19]